MSNPLSLVSIVNDALDKAGADASSTRRVQIINELDGAFTAAIRELSKNEYNRGIADALRMIKGISDNAS